jgi:energy-coupling factor transport system ATP-binding protein
MIEFENLSFTYHGSATRALDEVNLRVEQGEIFLLVGESGSGKSTLARLATGALGPGDGQIEGRVAIDGVEVVADNAVELVGRYGLVQQDPESQMVTLRVEDEVAFGPENLGLDPEVIRERISWALRLVGAESLSDRLVATLSGGEQQKIAIASMLALKPELLILDEPTSSLDPGSSRAIGEILGTLRNEGITIVVIEHRISWIKDRVDRMARISNGRITSIQRGAVTVPTRSTRPEKIQPTTQGDPVISIRNLSYRYDGRQALDDVTLDVYRGETIALMGNNGAGKSTLLMLLMGFMKPDNGSLMIPGFGGRTSLISRHIGFLFQNPNHQIIESTVGKDLILAPRNFGMAETEELDLRLAELIADLGLSGMIDTSPYRLSLGEKRRLNFGSVDIYQPGIYLLDEPFIGQDDSNVDIIMGLVHRRVASGGTCLLATHDPDLVDQHCDRVAFLERGRLAYLDKPGEVFAKLEDAGLGWYLPSGWSGS